MTKNLRLTVEPQYGLLEWARCRCGVQASTWPAESEALGITEGDELRAVFVFNAFDGNTCAIHLASDHTRRWATRNILGGVFGYAFEFKRMDRLNAVVPAANRKTIIAALKLGFQFEGRMRRASVDGTDAVLLSMLKDECSWLRPAGPASQGDTDHG